jgi:hypothetical protein
LWFTDSYLSRMNLYSPSGIDISVIASYVLITRKRIVARSHSFCSRAFVWLSAIIM